MDELTGEAMWDPIASIVIGTLLVAVAVRMGRDTGRLLVGAAARDEERGAIREVLEGHPGVVALEELLTMVLGPEALLVAARVDLDDRLSAGRVEQIASDLDSAIRRRVPDVSEVFLDATPGAGDRRAAARDEPRLEREGRA